jgi:AAA15 family ATPase/GTPase
MLIRNVQIKNFRGIQKMDWTINSSIACLIGPGDSTKSTILDAIEFTLSPRWNLTFEDCDFYLGDTNNPIEIIVTIGQLPEDFFNQEKFGLLQRGWSTTGGIHDEPQENDEPVLSIRLRIDKSLEPEWIVINDRDVDGRAISSKDRERLGMNRLGAFIDKHLHWGQGSALSAITTEKKEAASSVIVDAHRQARDAAKIDGIPEFKNAVEKTEKTAKELGVKLKNSLRPALDSANWYRFRSNCDS